MHFYSFMVGPWKSQLPNPPPAAGPFKEKLETLLLFLATGTPQPGMSVGQFSCSALDTRGTTVLRKILAIVTLQIF